MKIIVEEEYGFKYWLWEIEGTKQYICDHFNEVTKDKNYYSGLSNGGVANQFEGKWKELTWEEYRDTSDGDDWDMFAHVHTNDDSNIRSRTDGAEEGRVLEGEEAEEVRQKLLNCLRSGMFGFATPDEQGPDDYIDFGLLEQIAEQMDEQIDEDDNEDE